MDSIIAQILQIKEEYGDKHFSRKVKNTPELYAHVEQCYGKSASEKIYNLLFPGNNKCSRGNYKTFNSINEGYRFCGRAAECECAKESVSKNVSITKQSESEESKKLTHDKRVATSLTKYGVINNGQLPIAKKAHSDFYLKPENVATVTAKVKKTKLEKYGNENYNNIEQTKQTVASRSPEYWAIRYDNLSYIHLLDYEYMSDIITRMSCIEIASQFKVHVQTVYKHLNKLGIRDPYKSIAENEIVGFLAELGITNIVRNTRKLIKKEIDIYLPDYNLAIEYNGLYWHHDLVPHIDHSYHWNKFKKCEELDIQLITIFSNFWRYKKDIVKQLLMNKLGVNQTKIHARKCNIREVSTREIKEFLNHNHVQGYTTSSINYALFYENSMVAVMTFGKTRVGIGKTEDAIELIRFASSVRVMGGASKLLTRFISDHSPTKIISYSNNEWSTGHLYETLGFTLETEICPSYWYVTPREEKLYHRFNFAKHKLVAKGYDAEKSEREITFEMGLIRVWDCGKRRWVLDTSKHNINT